MNTQPTKNIFCAQCQVVTSHTGIVDAGGEFLFECQNSIESVKCDRFIKFAANTDAKTFAQLVNEHQLANQGQVSKLNQQKKLDILFAEPEELPLTSPVTSLEEKMTPDLQEENSNL